MSNIIEIVLENINHSKVCQLLMAILRCSEEILEVQCSEDIKLSSRGDVSEGEVGSFISLSEDASLIIKLSRLDISGVSIPSVLLRLVKYSDKFDIDFNFEESDIADMGTAEIMKKLHTFISGLGKQYEVDAWYGGIEPASDEDTRYFSGSDFGPLC